MIRRLITFIALFTMGQAVTAQEARGGYPSLAKRATELRDRTVPPPAPVAAVAADPVLIKQIAMLGGQATAGNTGFQKLIAESRRTVATAAGTAANSEAWINAQMAISVLDSARYESVAAMAGLDSLYVERQNVEDAARVTADLAAINPERMRTLAMVDMQNDALDGLRTLLRQP